MLEVWKLGRPSAALTVATAASMAAAMAALSGCAGGDGDRELDESAASASIAPASSTLSPETFAAPPRDYAPRTWFHAMSGNMSEAGLTRDLEAIARIGVSGVTLFTVTQGVPFGDVPFGSDEHYRLVTHMAAECERLGLTFGMHNADGWTSSGGPWVPTELSMKKLVWSEAGTSGGAVAMALPQPEMREGYYRDVAVLAYPALSSEAGDRDRPAPAITASEAGFDAGTWLTDDPDDAASLDGSTDDPAWVAFDYGEPVTVRGVWAHLPDSRGAKLSLWAEGPDGFARHADLPLRRPGKHHWALDAVVAPVTARRFRLVSETPVNIAQLRLSETQVIDGWMGRTGIARTSAQSLPPIGEPVAGMAIDPRSVIDLTDALDADGRLTADLPEGAWTILRFGETATGAVNIPASVTGTGLETDKFSAAATKLHYDAYVGRVAETLRDVAPTANTLVQIDSYEVGGQNWTDGFAALFEEEYGYSLTPYLPLYAGRFVGGGAQSDAVLGDARRLQSKLVAENYYGAFAALARADGLSTIIEPYGFGPFNDLAAAKPADVPMGEFWINRDYMKIAAAVSAAHVYGKPIASTEAFTAQPDINWRFHPGMVKAQGDAIWARGVNEFTFHRFAHQANTNVMPGMVMNRYGANFDRTQPWWDSAGAAWVRYISRGQYLLRQGVPITDVLLVLPEEAPSSCPERNNTGGMFPAALTYDCAAADAFAGARVVDGAVVLKSGAVYDVIMLSSAERMSAGLATDLAALAKAGASMIGDLPTMPLGRDTDGFTQSLAAIGREMTTATLPGPDLAADGVPDQVHAHRRVGDDDVYFLPNLTGAERRFTLSLEGEGSYASVWDPMDGSILPLSAEQADERVRIEVSLPTDGAAFIVLSADPYEPVGQAVPMCDDVATEPIDGPWAVRFDPAYGGGEAITLTELSDLKDHPSPAVRHYSGRVVYETAFDASALPNGERAWLDLGDVAVAATVTLNGEEVAVSWMPPHRIDVTEALAAGVNTLSVDVDTLWINRLIGDAGLPDTDGFEPAAWFPKTEMPDWFVRNEAPVLGDRVTFTTADFYGPDDPLVPSGLIGPVRLITGTPSP